MTNPLKTPQALTVAILLARVPLGVYFLIAGYIKIRSGVEKFSQDYSADADRYLSPQLAATFLHALPFVAMIVGVALIVGIFTRVAAGLAAFLLLSVIVASTGIAFSATGKAPPIHEYVVFLGLSLLLMTTGGGEMTVDHTFKKGPPGPPPKK